MAHNCFRNAVFLAAVLLSTASGAQTADRKPTFSFSMANKGAQQQPNGPLFRKASQALAEAVQTGEAGYERFLAKGAKATLMVHSAAGPGPEKLPFTVETIRAATNSCIGPYSFDEGRNWAQLSFVCRVDPEAPLSKLMTFRDSPELTLTIWFNDGLIQEIDAMEPLPIPGKSLVTMDAYSVMKSKL